MAEGVCRALGNPPGMSGSPGDHVFLGWSWLSYGLAFRCSDLHFWSSHDFPVQKKQEQKAPDRDAIAQATASLPPCNMDRAVVQTGMRDVSAAGGPPRASHGLGTTAV